MNNRNSVQKTNKNGVLASKSFKAWKRAKRLKIALVSSIGVTSLAGGLAGGFA
jgi:hypothetical protein